MSDRIAAHIAIGGALSRSKLPALLKAIAKAEVATSWGDTFFQPQSEEQLLAVLMNRRLWLCDDESRDGCFPDLEDACRKLGLSYTRLCESRYQCDAEVVDWRPGMRKPLVRVGSNVRNVTYVPEVQVRKVLVHLQAGRVGKAKSLLRSLCPEVPKLPPCKIV